MPDDAISRRRRTEDGGQTPDAELLRLYAEENSEAAFAELVRRYLDLVYSAALRQVGGDAHCAHDVAQTVFIALARKADAVARHPVLVGWLYTSTQHAAAKVRRGEARRRAREHEAQRMSNLTAGDELAVEWERLSPLLDDAMRELKECDREVVLLRYFARRPFAEIGTTLRVSEDAARMRVERALEKLRGVLARRGVTSTGAALGVVLAEQAVGAAPVGLAGSVVTAAVGAAASAATTWVAVGQFMANSKLAVGVAGLCALVAVGLATREVVAREAADALWVTANRDYEAHVANERALERRVREAEGDAAQLAKLVVERRAAEAKKATEKFPAAPVESGAGRLAATEEGNAFLARHPEVNGALKGWGHGLLRSEWAAFFRELGLTPTQIEEFQRLMLNTGLVPGMDPDGKYLVLNAHSGLDAKEVARRVRALLGEDGYAKFKEFQRLEPARVLTSRVAGQLAFSETPLATEQARRLTELIDHHRRAVSPARIESFDWEAIMAGTRGFLSETQQSVLSGMRAEDRLWTAKRRAPDPLGTGGK